MLKENLIELQNVCRKKHLDLGESLLIMNRTYGWTWETAPDKELETLKQFFIHNWFHCFAILEPERHEQILVMKTQEADQYREFLNTHGEHGKKLMARRVKPEDFYWMKEAV